MKIDFNKNWKVKVLNSKDDYKNISVPYDAMIYEKRIDDAPSGKNCCWFDCKDYEFIKEFVINDHEKDKDLILEFEGIYHNATVFLNGEKIAFRPYGYTNFYVDITHEVKINETNVLKVIAYNSDQPNSRWYSGCGILRPVYLHILNRKRVTLNGIKISTVSYFEKIVNFNINTTTPGCLTIKILDGEKIIKTTSETTQGLKDIKIELPDLDLWNINNPKLYKAIIEFEGEKYEEKFGIRKIEYGNEGLLINGNRELLLGACIHSDNQLLGGLTNRSSEFRRVKLLKKAGYNAIRSAHNPISKRLLEACDELGMYVLDEYVDCWTTHKTKFDYVLYLIDYWKQDLKDMVDKDFNHPSVIMYSTGNEVGESSRKEGIELTKVFTNYLHSIDNTRPVTCGINIFYNFLAKVGIGFYNDKKAEKEESKNTKPKKKKAVGSEFFNNLTNLLGAPTLNYGAKLHFCDWATKDTFANMDIAGYNYGVKRYKHDLKKYQNRLILGTETFCADARYFYLLAQENKRIVGDFVWAGMDYLGEVAVGSEVDDIDCDNKMRGEAGWMSAGSGRIDLIGTELSEADYTKVCFEQEDIKIGVINPISYKSHHTTSSWKFSKAVPSYSFEGAENMETEVQVYSRAPRVALYLNDVLVGIKSTKKKAFAKFKIKYIPGILKAVGLDSKGNSIYSLSLKSASNRTNLVLTAENVLESLDDLLFIKIQYKDDEGILKPTYNEKVYVEVINGELVALGNGCPYSKDGYHNNFTKTYYGEALAIIKPLNKGEISINVKDNSRDETLKVSF